MSLICRYILYITEYKHSVFIGYKQLQYVNVIKYKTGTNIYNKSLNHTKQYFILFTKAWIVSKKESVMWLDYVRLVKTLLGA